jgi:acyl-homoserine-lactone acylase
VISQEGLNAYGAVTWGQFFVYQGFNDRVGWMHTSGGGDVIDEYLETVVEKNGKFFYQYGKEQRPFRTELVRLPYKAADGSMAEKTVTAYFTHRGPVVREQNGKWVSVAMMNEPLKALTQSFIRTKARNYSAFYKSMELRTNSSNNTVYADADGNIAYFHGNFMPVRDTRFDYTKPVNGAEPAADWKGLHQVRDTIQLFNPKNGWIQNTNNWPFSAAGAYSPRRENYPAYMSVNPENARGIHAVRVLQGKQDFTIDSLIAAAYDSQLTAFEPLLPLLLRAYDEAPASDLSKAAVIEQITLLRDWDLRYSLTSVPTSVAIYWLQDQAKHYGQAARDKGLPMLDYLATQLTPKQRLESLVRASNKLASVPGKRHGARSIASSA